MARTNKTDWNQLVKNPEHLPKAMATRWQKALKAHFPKGTVIKLEKSETLVPSGWDYANKTAFLITRGEAEPVRVTFTLNVARGDMSLGVYFPDSKRFYSVPRFGTLDELVAAAMSEIDGYV